MIVLCYVPDCNKKFETTTEFVQHVEKVHKLPSDNHFKCPFIDCIQVFTQLSSFQKHVNKHDHTKHTNYSANESNVQIDIPIKIIRLEKKKRCSR